MDSLPDNQQERPAAKAGGWSSRVGALVLVLGVVACVVWLIRAGSRGQFVLHVTPLHVLGLMFAWTVMVMAAATIWRRLLRALAGIDLSWRQSVMQTGVLLVGKYVPGGFFGLLGRLMQLRAHGRDAEVMAAQLLEQGLVLHAGASLGLVLGLGPYSLPGAIALGFAALVLGFAGLRILGGVLQRFGHRAGRWVRYARPLQLVGGLRFSQYLIVFMLQILAWLAFVAIAVQCMVMAGFVLDAATALLVARDYLISVLTGMVAIVAPGGIGVRELTFAALLEGHFGAGARIAGVVLAIRVATSIGDLVTGALASAIFYLDSRRARR